MSRLLLNKLSTEREGGVKNSKKIVYVECESTHSFRALLGYFFSNQITSFLTSIAEFSVRMYPIFM